MWYVLDVMRVLDSCVVLYPRSCGTWGASAADQAGGDWNCNGGVFTCVGGHVI